MSTRLKQAYLAARRRLAADRRERPLPEPCPFGPGSREKLAVLEERQAAGERLWHPGDAEDNDNVPAFLLLGAPPPDLVK